MKYTGRIKKFNRKRYDEDDRDRRYPYRNRQATKSSKRAKMKMWKHKRRR